MCDSDIIKLELANNSSCKVHIFGATVVSWICQGQEQIFVSSKALYDKKKAIRGGIPVVFPNFGPWSLGPQHGFARINSWEAKDPTKDKDGNAVATFILKDNDATRKMWDYKFTLTYTVTLRPESLTTELTVTNDDEKDFDFTCLLHTYIRVSDVTTATVSGLQGLRYSDKVNVGDFTEDRELVTISENVDRVYENSPAEHTITDGNRKVLLQKTNLPDTVVWNPWADKARGMADFGDDEYPFMVCVEPGSVSERRVLKSGGTYSASQTLRVL